LAQERFVAMLAGFFGVLGLLFAGIGVYGVTAYGVHRRRTELGLRVALGAAPAGVPRTSIRPPHFGPCEPAGWILPPSM
jgi:hypothetical protein